MKHAVSTTTLAIIVELPRAVAVGEEEEEIVGRHVSSSSSKLETPPSLPSSVLPMKFCLYLKQDSDSNIYHYHHHHLCSEAPLILTIKCQILELAEMYNLISFSSISQHTLIPFFMSCFSFNPLFSRLSWFSRLKLDLNFLRFAPVRKFSDGDGDEYSLGLLDLPELTLECILERLTPVELCRMGAVCTDLRERCGGNHFWARHMEQKWGRVVGDLSRREWLSHVRKTRRPESIITSNRGSFRALCETVFGVWPFFSRPFGCRKLGHRNSNNPLSPETEDSIMSQYVALESGQFWFPAQVHNRENGQAGFFLSCYDAHISYDWKTDTFRAKYPSQYFTSRMIEENIPWSRIRAAAVDTPPYELHISDCLEDLKPGDSIEIQWRKSDEFAYGWWYGVVGHDEGSCDGNENHCQCHCSETVTLEFNQYPANSRWRRTRINRKDHRQEGNKEKGFYGGIRKLYTDKEISTWRRLLPAT